MRTKFQILSASIENIPHVLHPLLLAPIEEAMQTYADEQQAPMIDFIALVNDMRKQQKLYFSTRQKTYMFKAKDLEKQVDEYMKKHFVLQKSEDHGNLTHA
jgi:hypothetical protein